MSKWLVGVMSALVAAGAIGGTPTVEDATPTLEQMWAIVQAQAAEIEVLKADLGQARQSVAVTEQRLDITADYLDRVALDAPGASKTAIGGYGELHYNNLDAEDRDRDLEEADFHRFILFVDHEFSDRTRFVSELEVEHSLVGEGQPGGAVELEQAFIEIDLDEHHYTRSGLFLVPVGILNETHEPPAFYGVERNDVENIILPSTWWEAGADVGGRYASGFSWDVAIHTGLEMATSGSDAFRVRSGRQKVANANADDLAYTLRGRFTGLPGLDLSAALHVQTDPSQNADDGLDDGTLINFNAIYRSGGFALRALWAQWNFDGDLVEAAGADEQTGWYVEPSYRFNARGADLGAYFRFEDVEGARAQDRFDQWQIGLNWYPVPDVVFKLDWRDRSHDLPSESGRDFDGFDVGLGYQF